MRKSRNRLFLIIALFLLTAPLLPVPVYADIPGSLKTYTVYNDFNATVNTFQRLGLIMSDSRYLGLFFSIVVCSILIGGLSTIFKGIMSGKSGAMSWVYLSGMLLAGLIIYSAFIRNTTTITVYDEALGKQIAIGGIPDGVAFIAGLANKIETGIVDIIWTSGDPRSYRENAGGIGFNIITEAFKGGADLSGTSNGGSYNNMSIRRYIKDCLYFELTRPGSTLSINDIQVNSDFIPLLEKATNPSIYTVWYDEANKAGTTMSCTQAWTKLNTYFGTLTDSSTTVDLFWEERCKKVMSDVAGATGPSTERACKDKTVALLSDIIGITVSESQLMRQYLISSEMWNVMTDGTIDSQISQTADQSTGISLMGMALQAQEWLPIMKSVMFSIMLGTLPFLFLLVPTPIFTRAIGLIFGMFVFLTSWNICDALVHSFAMDRAYDVFDGIKKGEIGLKGMLLMSDTSCKALAAFGAARGTAMMFAGLISSMLVKFGGSMLAHTLSGLASKNYGAGAAAATLTSQGFASHVSGLTRSVPTAAHANQFGFSEMTRSGTYEGITKTATNLGAIDKIGNGNIGRTSGRVSEANVMTTRGSVAKSNQIRAAANNQFGGNVDGMLNAGQAITQGKAAGQAAQIISDGKDPLEVGGNVGQSEGANMEATGDRFTTVGGKGVYNTEASKKFNEDSKMGVRRALDDIAQTGNITPETKSILKNIASHPLGRAQLASQGVGDRLIKPGTEAKNFESFLSKHGKAVNANDLAGSTAQMNMWTDKGGNLHPALVATNKGVKVAEHNTGTKQYDLTAGQASRITGKKAPAGHYNMHTNPATGEIVGITGEGGFKASTSNAIMTHNAEDGTDRIQVLNPENGKAVWTSAKLGSERIAKNDLQQQYGWSGQFGGHSFASAERTDLGGGRISIDGVTTGGQRVTLVGTSHNGNERIMSMTQEQGPNYKGAIAMTMRENVPKETMHNPLHRAVFANQHASEMDKFYSGSMSKDEAIRLSKTLSAQAGLNIGIPRVASIGGGAKTSKDISAQTRETSARDIVAHTTQAILGSNLSDAQKQSAMRTYTNSLISKEMKTADDLPSARTELQRDKHPLGEVKDGSVGKYPGFNQFTDSSYANEGLQNLEETGADKQKDIEKSIAPDMPQWGEVTATTIYQGTGPSRAVTSNSKANANKTPNNISKNLSSNERLQEVKVNNAGPETPATKTNQTERKTSNSTDVTKNNPQPEISKVKPNQASEAVTGDKGKAGSQEGIEAKGPQNGRHSSEVVASSKSTDTGKTMPTPEASRTTSNKPTDQPVTRGMGASETAVPSKTANTPTETQAPNTGKATKEPNTETVTKGIEKPENQKSAGTTTPQRNRQSSKPTVNTDRQSMRTDKRNTPPKQSTSDKPTDRTGKATDTAKTTPTQVHSNTSVSQTSVESKEKSNTGKETSTQADHNKPSNQVTGSQNGRRSSEVATSGKSTNTDKGISTQVHSNKSASQTSVGSRNQRYSKTEIDNTKAIPASEVSRTSSNKPTDQPITRNMEKLEVRESTSATTREVQQPSEPTVKTDRQTVKPDKRKATPKQNKASELADQVIAEEKSKVGKK